MHLAGREEFTVSQSGVDMPVYSKQVWVAPHRVALKNTDISFPVHVVFMTVYIDRNITNCLSDCVPSPK